MSFNDPALILGMALCAFLWFRVFWCPKGQPLFSIPFLVFKVKVYGNTDDEVYRVIESHLKSDKKVDMLYQAAIAMARQLAQSKQVNLLEFLRSKLWPDGAPTLIPTDEELFKQFRKELIRWLENAFVGRLDHPTILGGLVHVENGKAYFLVPRRLLSRREFFQWSVLGHELIHAVQYWIGWIDFLQPGPFARLCRVELPVCWRANPLLTITFFAILFGSLWYLWRYVL